MAERGEYGGGLGRGDKKTVAPRGSSAVMPGLVPGIHAVRTPTILRIERNVPAWMAGTSPAMTRREPSSA
ncbi:MAG: hypothetical protein CTY15_05380 [Methylocystis sp.]|nr:MAG: hypothetical protein CTY15_05380 [Methylocystis sp.]